jgi:hypothetical protein
MYGIVNKAIQGLVTENFGENVWEEVKREARVDVDLFLSNEGYPDKMTFDLAGSASKVLKISVNDVLVEFGKYWVLKTGMRTYGELMKAGGNNFKEFIINLPAFHIRVMLMYPNLSPPEFSVSDIIDDELVLNYYSHRNGLTYFVYGLIQGLGEMYKTEVKISIVGLKCEGLDHDSFNIVFNG